MDPVLAKIAKIETVGKEGEDAILKEIYQFVQAGGVLDWATWERLDPVTRGAFIIARQTIEAERMKQLAQALAMVGIEG